MRKWLIGAGIAALAGLPGALYAQTVPLRTTDTTGPLTPLGQTLDDLGIRIRSQLVDEFAANPVGGVTQGNTNVGQLQLGASFNLDKIVGWKGAQFHITFVRDYGDSQATTLGGTFIKTQEIYKNIYQINRMGVFALEQKLDHDKIDIFVGRLGSTTFYGRLANSCNFQSGISCSVPQILNSSAGVTFPTSATWGANVRARIGSDIYVEAGAFEVDPYIQDTSGFYWSTKHATGFSVPFEAAKGIYDLDKSRYPSSIKIGGYYSTAPFNDPFLNTKGQSIGLHGGTPLPADHIRHGVYIMGEKAIWRPSERDARSLAIFGGWIQPLEDEEVMRTQVYGGAVLRAPLYSRPHDILSFETSYFRLSDKELAFLDDARIRAGGSGLTRQNEYAFELDYSALLYRGVRLAPNVLYIVNPDDSVLPKTKFVPRNEVVLGLKFTLNLSGLLGLPVAPNLSD
jgi:porin